MNFSGTTKEALYDTPMFGEFAGLDIGADSLPDESTILRFRHLLQQHELGPRILAIVSCFTKASMPE
jgi:IS5 family transposase